MAVLRSWRDSSESTAGVIVRRDRWGVLVLWFMVVLSEVKRCDA
jgi:hypothetical protein